MHRASSTRTARPDFQNETTVRSGGKPGAALIVPGRDEAHATSAARYLEECLPKSEYWDVPPEAQDEYSVPGRLQRFLQKNA